MTSAAKKFGASFPSVGSGLRCRRTCLRQISMGDSRKFVLNRASVRAEQVISSLLSWFHYLCSGLFKSPVSFRFRLVFMEMPSEKVSVAQSAVGRKNIC